ncbi:MAG: hypothetical protein R8K20_04940 [Gallionellaceae bacterium]
MKINSMKIRGIALLACITIPAISFAAAPTSGAYITDPIDQYVEDQASTVLAGANSVLCYVKSMNPNAMVNQPSYIALIDSKKCESNSGGGRSGNTGASYQKATVTATQVSGGPLFGDVWVDSPYMQITVKYSALTAPSTTLAFGEFNLNWCGTSSTGTAGSCDGEKGFITAGSSGLSYFTSGMGQDQGVATQSDALTLVATSADAGNGSMLKTATLTGGTSKTKAITFAYNATHFLRSDDAGVTQQCFDRLLANADKSAWSYGLYDSTGAQVTRNSGFPIEYTDPTTSAKVNGYIGYWGFWSQGGTTPASGTTISKISYANGSPVATNFTLLQSGGKLIKHTASVKTLAAVNKQRFWFYNMNAVTGMTAGAQYELYWDDAAKQFMISGKQNTTTNNMEAYTTPVAIANADMVTAASWGLYAWANGSQWSIDGTAMSALATSLSTTSVNVVSEDIVYPDQYAAITGGLKCVIDCPQPTAATATPAFLNDGSSTFSVATANLVSYTLNTTTGDLTNAASAAVKNLSSNQQWAFTSNTQGSGKLIDATTFAAITPTTAGQYTATDLAAINTFYTWQSSSNSWDQLSILKDSSGAVVKFDAPMKVDFVVPANTDTVLKKPYGNYAGTTLSLEFGGFGDLWGIPSSCIDLITNSACDFTKTTQDTFRWKPEFSIPFDGTAGVVTFTPTGGTLTTYYVKPLSQEVRLRKVATTACTTAGLAYPTSTPTLPVASGWTDPALGTIPTVSNTAPRVIQGVVMY